MMSVSWVAMLAIPSALHSPWMSRTLDWVLLLANITIATTLIAIRVKFRRDIAVGAIVVALAVFIAARGVPYLLMIVAPPTSFVWLTTNAKLIAALASLCVASTLPFLVPRIGELLASARTSRLNEQRFVAASHNSSESFFILESVRNAEGEIDDFRFAFANENGARMFSSTLEALQGSLLCAKFPAMREEGFFSLFKRTALTGVTLEDECPIRDHLVNAAWIGYRAEKLGDGLVLSMSDISIRMTAEQEAATALMFSRSLIAKSPFAVIALDIDGSITQINRAAERMLGYVSDELVGKETALVLHDPAELAARAETLSNRLGETVRPDMMVLTANPRRGVTDEAEWNYIRKDGSRLWVQLTVSALTTEEKQITGWLCFAYDITDRKRTQDQIAHMAQHDALTGLPTRTLLHDRLQMAIERSQRSKSVMALLMIDLDNFKRVNDLHGHSAGDELLVAVAKRLENTVRKSDTVARMGGDEFVVLLEDLKSPAHAERVAQKLIEALSVPVHAGGESLPMSASIGLCVYPDGGRDSETLLKNADVAMYYAKSEGRAVYRVFSTDIASATARRRVLESALDSALVRDELAIVYQPQVSFETGCVTGVEALLRWNSKALGVVHPSEFIPIAEETGAILPIGEWVLKTACREASELGAQLGRPLMIAVNLSPRQFQQESLPTIVHDALDASGLPPHSLELEITENVLVSDSSKAMRILDRLRGLGLRIAIDDFGTGFSSMSYILRFNVNRLKIDQSFIRDITVERHSSAIARAIIAMATGLKINVVAEGVETSAIGDMLREEGCDEAQGFYYARPAALADIPAIIAKLETEMSRSAHARRAGTSHPVAILPLPMSA
jgi:diguanylate cyclase (GGDEF)-like protein/PAS domain S-box-containing protein